MVDKRKYIEQLTRSDTIFAKKSGSSHLNLSSSYFFSKHLTNNCFSLRQYKNNGNFLCNKKNILFKYLNMNRYSFEYNNYEKDSQIKKKNKYCMSCFIKI